MAAGATIGALKFVLGADTAEFEKALGKATTSLQRVAVVGTAIGTVIGNTLVAAFRGLTTAIRGAIDQADKLDELSESLGISTEQLSAFQFAAKMSGVEAENFGRSIVILARNMAQAASDAKSQVALTFREIGVSVTDAAGKLRPTGDVLLDLAQKFQGWTDGAGKAAIATALFGRSGADLIPFLNQGRDGIGALTREAERLGIVISGDTAKKAGELNDTFDKMKAAFDGFIRQILVPLLPLLQQAAEMFARWTQESAALKVAITALDIFFRVFLGVIATVNSMIQDAIIWIGALINAAKALSSLDWNGFTSSFSDAMKRSQENAEALTATIRRLRGEADGLGQSFQNAVGKVGATAPPIITSVTAAAAAASRLKDEARAALDELVSERTNTAAMKLDAIRQAYQNNIISATQMGKMVRTVEKENQNNILDTASLMASTLTSVFAKSKAASIAAAIINTAVGITKALATLPPPFSWAQAALIAATGAAQIATIRSSNVSGSGSSPTVSSGSGGEEPGAGMPAQTLMVQGISSGDLFTGDAVRDLAQRLIDFQRDGGQVVLK